MRYYLYTMDFTVGNSKRLPSGHRIHSVVSYTGPSAVIALIEVNPYKTEKTDG